MKKLPRSFYLRPTLVVARDLLGKLIVRKTPAALLTGMIVEVEAYLGERDPASHAFKGKTRRNEVMFRTGGHLYVYFTYGMHYCANVVTGKEGMGRAVLLRAIAPLQGVSVMQKNRNHWSRPLKEHELTNGPAKLCEAFGIDRRHDGINLLGDEIFITEGNTIRPSFIGSSPRIGISKAVHHKWRFFLRENPWVSR
jgi:DNA-3-methyladenine glycosylase